MRVTLDTNVLVAAFISRGVCHDLFEHLIRQHQVVASNFILDEFRRVLLEKFGVPTFKVEAAEKLIRSGAALVHDAALDERISREPDDDWMLSVAISSESDCLVTADDVCFRWATFGVFRFSDRAISGNSRRECLAAGKPLHGGRCQGNSPPASGST